MNLQKWFFVVTLLMVSCQDILEVPDISGQTVNILAPTNGSVVTTNTVNLNWETVENATAYNIQVAFPDFENAAQLALDSIVELDTLGNVSRTLARTLDNGNYEWRIKAQNSDYETPYTTSDFQVNGDEELTGSIQDKTHSIVLSHTTGN